MKNLLFLMTIAIALYGCNNNKNYTALKICTDTLQTCVQSCEKELDVVNACSCEAPSTPFNEDDPKSIIAWGLHKECSETCKEKTRALIRCRRDCQEQFNECASKIEAL